MMQPLGAPCWERDANTGNSTNASGLVCLSFFTARDAFTFTKIGTGLGTAGSGATLCRLGIYTVAGNGDLTLVARTANDTTIATAGSTIPSKALDTTGGFPASYGLVRGSEYAWALIFVGTTSGSWVARALGGSAMSLLSPRVAGSVAGQSDLPSIITNGSIGGISVPAWGFVEA